MQNGAYTLAWIAAIGGLVFLLISGQGDARTAVAVVLLLVAALLGGLGKAIDVLGYVREGASSPDDPE